jgi:hypothetical protein
VLWIAASKSTVTKGLSMVAKVQASFSGGDRLKGKIAAFDQNVNRVIAGQILYAKPEATAHMKNYAPWTDRTGNARSGLHAQEHFGPNVAELVLAHSVSYGIWLETRWNGRYAVLWPTSLYIGSLILSRLESSLLKLAAAQGGSLANYEPLNDIGVDRDSIFHNYSLEDRPVEGVPFVILNWLDSPPRFWDGVKAPEKLDLWMNIPKEITEDFMTLNSYLDLVDDCFDELQDVAGVDGYTLSFISDNGRSKDIEDKGFKTIARSAHYNVFYRKS